MLRWKLKYNDMKSKVLVVGKIGKGLRWNLIELVYAFEYLGVCFD